MMDQEKSLPTLKLEPSQFLLENWKYWIALEVISQLKSREIEVIKSSNISGLIKIEIEKEFNDLWLEFNQHFEIEKEESALTSEYELSKKYLSSKFQNIITNQVNNNSANIRARYCQEFKDSLLDDYQNSSPEKVKCRLKDISKLLLAKKRILGEEILSLESKLKSVYKAYSNLASLEDINTNRDSIWNALNFIFYYDFRLKITIVSNEIVYEIITILQSFYNSVDKSVRLLNQVETLVKNKCSNKLFSIPILTNLDLIDIGYQQSLMEVYMEDSIAFWGDKSRCPQDLEENLLNNLDLVTRNIFYKFQLSFFENSRILENK